jgi:cellulose synthase/poly-beta-1,6-N-acetylglucosamine synthase-like glycosyltransferase/transposase-like protein
LKRFTAKEKLTIVKDVVDRKASVYSVCKTYHISKNTFYNWFSLCKKAKKNRLVALEGKVKKGNAHPRSLGFAKKFQVLRLAHQYPEYSSHKIAQILNIGNHGVQNILEKEGLSRYSDRLEFVQQPFWKRMSAAKRLEMMNLWLSGWKAQDLCQHFGISKVTFSKWKTRFLSAGQEFKVVALADQFISGDRHYRFIGADKENMVLDLIKIHPEWSAHRIHRELVHVIGHHGIQNVLARYSLNTINRRYAWARVFEQKSLSIVPEPIALPLKKLWWQISPFETIPKISFSTAFLSFLSVALIFAFLQWIKIIFSSPTQLPGFFFASTALFFGFIFFLYSLKYYLTIIGVLSFPSSRSQKNDGVSRSLGLATQLPEKLERQPFVSVHLPLYNESKVVERLLIACSAIEYPGFEIIVVDDSTDETTEIVKKFENWHPGNQKPVVKVIHRISRQGFKGGALAEALKYTNPQAEYILIFDADFVPYPDTIEQFLKYFQLAQLKGRKEVAVVQGYQWHVLNKSENWITRGVRSEFSGSYVVERAGTELYGGLKMIAGSVYMIKREILEKFGWGTSITEDFQLTLKLYEAGYKVCYTPYIQTPSECVSTFRRLIRQRMRWAEGHTYNIKKMFGRLFFSPNLTFFEKLEFLYLGPYYLQAAFFLLGSFAWIVSELVFRSHLPFWSATLGWSLIFTNLLALPTMNIVGLFLEEGKGEDFAGALSFIVMSYLLIPFQSYAAVKGIFEKEEGPWFRTPKTGRITDIFGRAQVRLFWRKLFPFKKPALAQVETKEAILPTNYSALATSNSQFNNFSIKPQKARWVSKAVFGLLLALTVTVFQATRGVPEVFATNPATKQYLWNDTTATLTGAWILASTVDTQSSNTTIGLTRNLAIGNYQFNPGAANSTAGTKCGSSPTGKGWILDTPFGGSGGSVASGAWTFFIYESDNAPNRAGHIDVCVYSIAVSGGSISANSLLFQSHGDASWSTTDTLDNGVSQITQTTSSQSQFNIASGRYLYVEYWLDSTTKVNEADVTETFYTGETGTNDPYVLMPAITIPENSIVFLAAVPLIPYLVNLYLKRKEKERYLFVKVG